MRSFISEHRFRLILALCAFALAAMIAGIYATTGFNLAWNAPSGSGQRGEPRDGAVQVSCR